MQVEKADLEVADLVVGLLIGGVSRVNPVRLLSLHEVVNNKVGDRAIAGEELSFRASGYLLHDALFLIAHPTVTLWSLILCQGIKGT